MKKLLFLAAALATLGLAVPASAQVFLGADSYGAGVQVGPLGVGVGPRFWGDRYYHRRGYYAQAHYSGNCHQVRSRVVRPSGRVVYRMRQICR